MTNGYTLSVACIDGRYLREPYQLTLTVPALTNLRQLAVAILDTLEFDNDHLDEFYIASSVYGKSSAPMSNIRGELAEEEVAQMRLSEVLPLPKNKKLFYLFDHGDGWRFEITARGKPTTLMADQSCPCILAESGVRPLQYGNETDEDDD
jgi:hypothetical protein